jgi:AraC-like DNA-binding protein
LPIGRGPKCGRKLELVLSGRSAAAIRQVSQATGLTISQFLRQARLDRAAQLLRAGTHNVTEAALEVGYNSLSHFTVAFREAFGCCPGLYPLRHARKATP